MDTVESYYYMYTGTCIKETRENSKGETVKGTCTLYTVRLSIISDISYIINSTEVHVHRWVCGTGEGDKAKILSN